jgi:hypothetical protein
VRNYLVPELAAIADGFPKLDLRPDGAVAATVTTNGAWFGLRSRRIEAPPSELVAATDSIKSEDFTVLESPACATNVERSSVGR